MDIQVLAATADRTERRILRQLLGNLPDDVDRMVLRFVARVRPAGRPTPLRLPDILMLDAAAAGPDGPPLLAALTAPCVAVPVILLVAAPTAGIDLGAAQVVLAQASRQLLRALIASIVTSARAAMPADTGAAVLAAIADAVISTGADGKITYCNPAAERLMQLTREQMLGSPVAALMLLQDPATLRPLVHPILEALARGQTIRLQAGCILVRPDGSEIMIDDSTAPIAGADGTTSGAVMVFHDITEARELQAQVDYLAWHDFLTGLPNRFAAQRHLNRILLEAHANGNELAVMYLDLDRFKAVNDEHGHGVGDKVLVRTASLIGAALRESDYLARFGGEEFIVLLPDTDVSLAATVAQRIQAALRTACDTGIPVCTASIGIVAQTDPAQQLDDLLHAADRALYRAKANGRDRIEMAVEDMRRASA